MSNGNWLWKYVRPMRWMLLLAVLLSLLDMVSLLGITGIQKWLIDDVFVDGQYDRLYPYLGIFAALIIGYNAVHLFSFLLNRSNEFALQKKLTTDLMHYMYRMKVSKYASDRIGSIAQRFSGDIGETGWLIGHYLPGGITSIAQVIVLSAWIGWANPYMLLGVCFVSIVFILAGRHLAPRQKAIRKEVQEARADVLVQIEEGIASTREVVAYHRQKWEIVKYNRSFDRYMSKAMKEGKLNNKQLALSEPFRLGMHVAVLAYGAYLAITGRISVGTFVVTYQFSLQLLDGLQNVFGFFMNVASKTGSIERLKEYMSDSEPQTGDEFKEDIKQIEFQNVTFRYSKDSAVILNGLHLTIPAGLKVAFVGSSGGGKSTIAQLMVRFYEPSQGEIRVNGIPLAGISVQSWRSKISLVPQEPYLFPDTIRNNLAMGRADITDEDIVSCCRVADIHSYIESLPDGYDTLIGERGITLSGGQRQRLAIARSLLSDPELLILDEATSALDLETERQVQRNLDALRSEKTTVIIAHRLSTVENADLIYVLDKGKVVESGNHEMLMKSSSLYQSLVSAMREDAS